MHRPRVFVEDVSGASSLVSLDRADAHHLARVLRLRAGDEVGVFDGGGREWLGQIATLTGSSATVDIVSALKAVPEPPVHVTVALGVLKGDPMDHAVRDATALGAAAIVPIASQHSSVSGRSFRSGAAVERWQRIALASAKQCGRSTVPRVHDVRSFEDVLGGDPSATELICVIDTAAQPRHPDRDRRPAKAVVFIGPEGGWASGEVDRALAAGAIPIHLGPRTLRAETVPVVVLASLWTTWGWRT